MTMLPQRNYFLIDLASIVKEIEMVQQTQSYCLNEAYLDFNAENSMLILIDLEVDEIIWDIKTNFLDYNNKEDNEKMKSLCSLWNSGYPVKVLPPVLNWDELNGHFTIIDGFHRARLYSNVFAADDREGALIFLIRKECYNTLPENILSKLILID